MVAADEDDDFFGVAVAAGVAVGLEPPPVSLSRKLFFGVAEGEALAAGVGLALDFFFFFGVAEASGDAAAEAAGLAAGAGVALDFFFFGVAVGEAAGVAVGEADASWAFANGAAMKTVAIRMNRILRIVGDML